MPRKKITNGEKIVAVQSYVAEKIVTKFGKANCQEIAQKAINDRFNSCNGSCEICVCKEANVKPKNK